MRIITDQESMVIAELCLEMTDEELRTLQHFYFIAHAHAVKTKRRIARDIFQESMYIVIRAQLKREQKAGVNNA